MIEIAWNKTIELERGSCCLKMKVNDRDKRWIRGEERYETKAGKYGKMETGRGKKRKE